MKCDGLPHWGVIGSISYPRLRAHLRNRGKGVTNPGIITVRV
jgi:hypothetical protein